MTSCIRTRILWKLINATLQTLLVHCYMVYRHSAGLHQRLFQLISSGPPVVHLVLAWEYLRPECERPPPPKRIKKATLDYNSRPCKATWDMRHIFILYHFVYFVCYKHQGLGFQGEWNPFFLGYFCLHTSLHVLWKSWSSINICQGEKSGAWQNFCPWVDARRASGAASIVGYVRWNRKQTQ